jgi:hypothetical protein
MKHLIITLLLCLPLLSLSAQGAEVQTTDTAIDAKIAEFLKLSGAEAQFTTAIDQIIGMQKQNPLYNEVLPSSFWDEFSEEVHETGFSSLLPEMTKLYKQHFTEEELDHQIAYLSNPLTQQIVAKQPALVQASMAVGSEWGQALGEKIGLKLQQEVEDRN